MSTMMKSERKGFTLVELLIVIVVIAILAAITVVAYNGVQNKARISSAQSDMQSLEKAITFARINTGQTLMQITGSGCTSCGTHTTLVNTLQKITDASGVNVTGFAKGDPWGNDYRIDENEGEQPANPCIADTLSAGAGTGATLVPVYKFSFTLPQCGG